MTHPLLLLLLLLACNGGVDETAPAGEAGRTDTAPPTPATFSGVEAELSETIPAVVIVRFEVEGGAGEPWVRFGPASEQGRYAVVADEQDDGSLRAVLVGCPATTDCAYTVGKGDEEGPEEHITTGEGPTWVETEVELEGDPSPGFLLTAALTPQRGAVILDAAGRLVWWWPMPKGGPSDLVTRVLPSPDGRSVWFNQFTLASQQPIGDSDARFVQVALDGSWEAEHLVPDNHHDFHLLDDGSLLWLGVEDRQVDGKLIRGCRLVKRSALGDEIELWNAWDSFDYDAKRHDTTPPTYWTLANHLERAEGGDGWVISLRNLATLVHVDEEGNVAWRFGQEDPDIEPDTPFAGQHGFDLLDDGLLLFDNGGDPVASRVLEFQLDVAGGTATTSWSHLGEATTIILGDVLRRSNDHTVIAWGQDGRIEELDASGSTLWQLTVQHQERPYPIGFLEHAEVLGREP